VWRVYVAVLLVVACMLLLSLVLGEPVTKLLKYWQGK
jgi:hypothetical protein